MNKLFLCCFPQKKEILLNNNEEEVEVKNNCSNRGEEKNDLVNSTKSRSKLSKSDETNNLPNNAGNKENRNSPRNDNQNAEGSGNQGNYYENKAGSENNSAMNNQNHINNNNRDNVSNLSINKIMQQNDNNSSSNVNVHGNFNTHNSNKEGSNSNINNNSNNNNKNSALGSHAANSALGKKEDVSIVDITSASRVITDEDVKNAPLIAIEEIAGNVLKNNKLTVNAAGLVGGARKMRDGVAFFGKKLKHGDLIVNDFELNIDYPGNGLYTFIIYYKKENNKYFLRAYRDKQSSASSMLLIKLEEEYYLTRKEILSISDYFFQLNPLPDRLEIHRLANKNSPNAEKFVFETSQGIVTIGRDSKCNIYFNGDKAFSKIQTSFTYDKDFNVWKIKDGSTDKPSTNGTWIFAAHSFEINDKTTFRLGNSKLVINYQ